MRSWSRTRRSAFTSSAIWSARSAAGDPQPRDRVEVFGPGVATVHRGEHTVRAGLQGKMKLRHQHCQVAVSSNKVLIYVARMAGRVTKPQHARHCRETIQ